MTARERVRDLIDVIPESDLATVERMLRGLAAPASEAAQPLTPEERRERAKAARGSLRGSSITVERFLREKHEETERDDARWEQQPRKQSGEEGA